MKDYSRSIILIPTIDEKENLERLIPGIFGLMPDISVLIVDDNSSDGTQELIESMKPSTEFLVPANGRGQETTPRFKNLFLLERKSNFGYGRSSIDGLKWILEKNYEFLITMDADFSHDFKVIPTLVEKLNDFDVAVGSRYIIGGGVKNWNFSRRTLSKFANFYVRMILGLSIRDATAGFNVYRVGCLKKIDLDSINSEGYAFLIELKYRLYRAGCLFVEHPILFSERREGQSKMSSKIIWEAIKLPWKLLFTR